MNSLAVPVVFGLNHATASFAIRQKMSFAEGDLHYAINRLQDSRVTSEVLILSTCNRVEIYCVTQDIDFVINAICDLRNICPRAIRSASYIYKGIDCARHLFKVASGLDSMILGESEIVAQIKNAYHIAKKNNSLLTNLAGLFQIALANAKEVRSATKINDIAISMGAALVSLVKRQVVDFDGAKIMFVGAGTMMMRIAPHFSDNQHKIVLNRSLGNGEVLATKIGAKFANIDALASLSLSQDVIIVCSSANETLITKELIHELGNTNRKIVIIDLSMPLVTDLVVREYASLDFVTVDDIARLVDVGEAKRSEVASHAVAIMEAGIDEYRSWLKKRGLSPIIKAIRDQADLTRQDVLMQAKKQLAKGDDVDVVLEGLASKLTSKLIHAPTVNLVAKSDTSDKLADLVMQLYDLDDLVAVDS